MVLFFYHLSILMMRMNNLWSIVKTSYPKYKVKKNKYFMPTYYP